ncbi:hypothetical protein [Streptomyces sp. NPDC055105]|uniref:hypothetical protein n=1 Tax=Streptomyces sp. NPDC055105 TaxID=3365719 RepID=UPI0037D82142
MGLDLRAGREAGRLGSDPWPSWSYTGFSLFRSRLAHHIGIDLPSMNGFGGEGDWASVQSPLRHLLDHPDDRGTLSVDQAAELAPALEEVLAEISERLGPGDDVRWDYDVRTGTDLVALLRLCVEEGVPVEFG